MMDELDLLKEFETRNDTAPSEKVRLRARRALAAAMEEGEDRPATGEAVMPADVALLANGIVGDAQSEVSAAADEDGRSRRPSWIALPGRHRRWSVAAASIAVVAACATVLATVVVPSGNPVGPTSAAAAVLDQAARRAIEASNPQLGPGQYVYLKTLEGGVRFGVASSISPISGTNPKLTSFTSWFSTSVVQRWTAPDRKGRLVVDPLSTKSAPAFLPFNLTSPVKVPNPHTPALGSAFAFYEGSPADPDANLPTNPTALNEAIVHRYEDGNGQASTTFQFAGSFLQETASPALRSALYRVVAQLPGVTSLGAVTDRLGRRGVGVALLSDGMRYELVFDPKTSAVLQAERVAVDPLATVITIPAASAGNRADSFEGPRYIPGTVISYTVYESTGIVDTTSAVPHGS